MLLSKFPDDGKFKSMLEGAGQIDLLDVYKSGNLKYIQHISALKLDTKIINTADKNGNTVLHMAAAHGNASEIDVAFGITNNLHQTNSNGMTPLMLLCGAKDIAPELAIKTAEALFNVKGGATGDSVGFDWKKEKQASKTPHVLLAYFAGKPKDFLKLLLEKEPSVARELFKAAAYNGDMGTLEFLMQDYRSEYDALQTSSKEPKPLSILLEHVHIAVASEFIEKSGLEKLDTQLLFDACALQKEENDRLEIFQELLEKCEDINGTVLKRVLPEHKDLYVGTTILAHSILKGDIEIFNALLESESIDINKGTKSAGDKILAFSPLELAYKTSSKEMMKAFLERKDIDISKKVGGKSMAAIFI